MELQKIHIENKVTSEVRIEIFDTYAENYNECKNKMERINFASNLSTLQSGYNNQLVELDKHIEGNLSTLIERLNRLKQVDYKKGIVDGTPAMIPSIRSKEDKDISGVIDWIIATLEDIIENLKNAYGTDNIEGLKIAIEELQEMIKNRYKINDGYFRLLHGTLNVANKYCTIKTHKYNLSTIINEIGVNNYPDEIKAYNERSKKEKSEIVITKDKNKKLKTGTPEFWDYVEELLSKISKEYNGDKLKKVYKSLEKQWDKYGIYGYNSFESFKASFYKAGRSVDVN